MKPRQKYRGKTGNEIDATELRYASMKPRQKYRGKKALKLSTGCYPSASMKPRQKYRGKVGGVRTARPPRQSFNEAAAKVPRKSFSSKIVTLIIALLQ